MKRFLFFVAIVVLAVLAVSRWNVQRRAPETFTPAAAPKLDLKDMQVLSALNREYTNLAQAVVPSVVSVTTSRKVQAPQIIDPFEYFFGPRRGRQNRQTPDQLVPNSLGSGVIVSSEGHILTNNHVVANVDEVKVQLNDGREFPAKVIGTDEATDIAVLKIDAAGIKPLPLGDSDAVKVGSIVFAIGNPFGLQETVTQGIISATRRQVADESGNEFFQTDTTINPGNSGGPLVNLRGEVIGINSAIGNYAGTGTWQGVGFATPSNAARRAMESIIKTGRVVRGYLGVIIKELTPELAAQFGVSGEGGAVVTNVVQGSPAEKAGIKPGDIITAFDGRPVKNIRDLLRQVSSVPVNSRVPIKLLRENKAQTVTATILEQPADFRTAIVPQQGQQQIPQPQVPQPPLQPPTQSPSHDLSPDNPLAGIKISAIPPDQRANLPANIHGVIVTETEPDSPAGNSLQPGDVIEEIARQPVENPANFMRIARTLQPGQRVMLFISRGKTRTFVVVPAR